MMFGHFIPQKRAEASFGASARGIIVALLLVLPLSFSVPTRAAAQETVQILLIGNSFTKGVKKGLKKILAERGVRAKIAAKARNGFTLGHHANSSSTTKAIHSRDWDWVVLQEQSLGTFHSRYPDARVLDARIQMAGSQTAFMMTWRDRGWAPITYNSLRGTIGEDVGYVPIAHELNAPVAPVGWAWRNAVVDGSSIDLWGRDGHHASNAGDYLSSMVVYATLFGESPIGLKPGKRLSETDSAYLQTLAATTVFGEASSWNLRP